MLNHCKSSARSEKLHCLFMFQMCTFPSTKTLFLEFTCFSTLLSMTQANGFIHSYNIFSSMYIFYAIKSDIFCLFVQIKRNYVIRLSSCVFSLHEKCENRYLIDKSFNTSLRRKSMVLKWYWRFIGLTEWKNTSIGLWPCIDFGGCKF